MCRKSTAGTYNLSVMNSVSLSSIKKTDIADPKDAVLRHAACFTYEFTATVVATAHK